MASEPFSYPTDDQYIPFSTIGRFSSNPYDVPQLYDASKLLMLDNPLAAEEIRLRRGVGGEIGGSESEVLATFQACLHVGRFERAEALLAQRLAPALKHRLEDLVTINHQYIRSLSQNVEIYRKEDEYRRLANWVEKGMDKLDIKQDGLSYAILLRSVILMLDGAERNRKIKKIWKSVEREQQEADVIGAGALTDTDLNILSGTYPEGVSRFIQRYNKNETPELEPLWGIDSDIDVHHDAEVATARSNPNPVRSVAQRGVGLRYLQESMISLSEPIELKPWLTAEENERQILRQRQEQLETTAVDAALRRWREERGTPEQSHQTPKMGPFLADWQGQLESRIRDEIRLIDEAEKTTKRSPDEKVRLEYGPFLRLVSPEKLAGVTIVTFLTLMSKVGTGVDLKLGNTIINIGRAVHMEAIVSSLSESTRKRKDQKDKDHSFVRYVDAIIKNEGAQALWKIRRRLREEKAASDSDTPLSATHWSNVTYAKVGGILAQLFMDIAKVKVTLKDEDTNKMMTFYQPAFQKTYKYELGKRIAFISMHTKVEERLRTDPAPAFIVKHLPMLCPPKPWTGFYEGGYYKTSVPMIRVKNSVDRQRKYVDVAASRGDLDSFFAGLDVLGRTSWKVNPDVYHVMLEAWNSGEAIANLAPAEYKVPQPPKPADWSDVNARKKWYNDFRRWDNEKTGLHSERCFQNLQMEMAQNFLNEKFYLPHNADFRGRAYPIAPYLNQMGADNARGLLLFGEGRPLGVEGLRWMKIHLANVFGYDKASLSEREQFATDHLDSIRDSVENPLSGKRWWLEAEDPWQCLAACFELVHALDSPNPEEYVSHLPVHQDGSCNGLQHYAALGGDLVGAQQVNLEPGDRPSDVYTGVAELIKADIAKEAAEGRKIAKLLHGKIKRKIVKQTVMTNVYGVTFLGAVRQVKKQLEAHYPEMAKAGSIPVSGLCAAYIARKIFNALGTIFTGAHHIQFWLGDCASRISASLTPEQVKVLCEKAESPEGLEDKKMVKSIKKTPEKHFRSGVTWTTPLNLTVVQPYRQVQTTMVQTAFQQVMVKDPRSSDTIDKRRQLQAFPPNFVHSLDATHMILSALRCDAEGLSFSAVHDSFWTHAAGVNEMNRLLRDAFVQMHSEDVIGRLATEFKLRYSRHLFRASIKPGASPLRTKIDAWRRQFKQEKSLAAADLSLEELKLEVKRQELLRSEDPEEVALGKKMVTPASIFDDCDGEQYLQTQKSLGETALGHIPETAPQQIIEDALNPATTDPSVHVDMETSIAPIVSAGSDNSELIGNDDSKQQPRSYVQQKRDLSLRDQILLDLGIPRDRELSDGEVLLVEMMEEARVEAKATEERKKVESVKSRAAKRMHIWLPLRLAEVPKRGEWDVTRLKQSDYFFS